MLTRKTLNIVLLLILSLSVSLLIGNAHAVSDYCATGCSSCCSQNLGQPPPIISCTIECCSESQKPSCNLEECLNPNLPDTIMPNAGMKSQTVVKILVFSKEGDFGYPVCPGNQHRHVACPKPISTPIYLKTLSLRC